jgi:mannosyltransferase OCH1-like enzyme
MRDEPRHIDALGGEAQRPENHIFSYWTGGDIGKINAFLTEWREAFPAFRLYGDEHVMALLDQHFPQCVDLFSQIRIPAARSDVARLILLYEYGGLYVDCHFGLLDKAGIHDLFDRLDEYEAIFVDRSRIMMNDRPLDEYLFINGALFMQKGSNLNYILLRQILANLDAHRSIEERLGQVYYHIGRIGGPGLLNMVVSRAGSNNREIRPDFADRVHVIREDGAPFVRNRHKTYYGEGMHWSERQVHERLFRQPGAMFADE